MIISCNTIVDKRDHVQYLTVSKSYSDNCTCSLTEQNTTLKNLYYGLIPQELEVRSFNRPYSLKTKSSQCHYVVMTRSETKFQAPLNRRYHDVFGEK